ncbi:MAG: AAA family ATPase [Spirulina sp.]
MPKAIQRILFGSPGVGKSYEARKIAEEDLGIKIDSEGKLLKNTVKTVFHPEYTYGDFIGKLLPSVIDNNVIYKFYPGHFLKALGFAYKSLIEETHENCLLVIDELNRGNASAIFGTVFQLLDREDDGWSSYEVDISEMELYALLCCIFDDRVKFDNDGIKVSNSDGSTTTKFDSFWKEKIKDSTEDNNREDFKQLSALLRGSKIKIPPNLSIIATINTSDESIYYLDSAFKRRWDWVHIEAPNLLNKDGLPENMRAKTVKINDELEINWIDCIVGLNHLIASNLKSKRVEDKQVGLYFIQPEKDKNEIPLRQIQDKLMFYLWDSVFSRDRRALEKIISEANQSIGNSSDVSFSTYTDFLKYTAELLQYAQTVSCQDPEVVPNF